MLRHTQECRTRAIPFIADPSQQLAFADGPEIRRLVDGAAYLFTNEYEAHLTEQKTGWSADEIMGRVDVRVITRGSDGVTIHRKGEEVVSVPVAREVRKADPTGVGDAFRAGFLTGLSGGLDLRRCAELGSMLATYVIETVGTQEYRLGQDHFLSRLADAYGPDSVDEIAPVVACRHG
jgi:adenosine kinase